MNGESHIPISREGNLQPFVDKANGMLGLVKWKPLKPITTDASKPTSGNYAYSSSSIAQAELEVSILNVLKDRISQDQLILSEDSNHVLHVVRDGICIGFGLATLYAQAAGLELLGQLNNKPGGLKGTQQEEFAEKNSTMAAVAVYSASAYIAWALSGYKEEQVSGINLDFPGIPEVFLTNIFLGMNCSIFWYGYLLEKGGIVKTDLQMVKMTSLYFQKLAEEIRMRASSFKHTEFFTRVSYQLKGSEFIVKGFEQTGSGIITVTEFNKLSLSEIVGNQEAKHAARRLVERLVCYDLTAMKNPFQILGGLVYVFLGFGTPGTGKSMLIAAIATMLQEYCELLGLPFLFWPLPDNIISTFQGGSAERMIPWMVRLQDKNKIIFGAIDDAENTLIERTRQGVSAGVLEVEGVFLRYTEGAYAIQRGNSAVGIFTNLPEILDKAVLSRIQMRFAIDGAKTLHDFYDQDYLWYQKLEKINSSFVGMSELRGYQYLADQAQLASLATHEKEEPQLTDDRMLEVMHQVSREHSRNAHGFYAALYRGVKEIYPNFTSRDVRNVQKAIDARILDFDLPREWFNNLGLFFHQPFEQKLELVKTEMRHNMKGLSFADIRFRETIKYLNVVATITNVEREREIAEFIQTEDIRREGLRRIETTKM